MIKLFYMLKRQSEKVLKELSNEYPVTVITGPRQSGKTTLSKMVFPNKPYVSFENPDTIELATEDPRGFLSKYQGGAIFDEIQRFPKIISYLQEIIDSNLKPGLFILTGSQQFGLLSAVTQSLAGRSAALQLLPFSLLECYKNLKSLNLDEIVLKGLYPPIHHRKLKPDRWYLNYIQTYVERDVRQLVNVKDLNSFQRFVKLCAARIGQILNLSSLANDCGITHNTAKSWISILEASYIIFQIYPHYKNFGKRIIKSPKIYFYDTGLAATLLSIKSAEQLNIHSSRGALFESFIISELIKYRYNKGLPNNFYFWRDRKGMEIDLLIEEGDILTPVEIKSGQTLNHDYFKNTLKWNTLSGNPLQKAYLIYAGKSSASHKGINVIPWVKYEKVLRT